MVQSKSESEGALRFLAQSRLLAGALGLVCLLAGAGCALPGHPVTGHTKATSAYAQSETALTTSFSGGKHRVVVAFNDGTNGEATIQYTETSRTVLPGASLMGWAFSEDGGMTWAYGGRVTPPDGWAAIWGDPALTTSGAHYNVVFMANLAIPSSKMPPTGVVGAVNNYIGGACIARSTDGGISFKVHQMVSNEGHFYDGGSLASNKKGNVFAAFVDVDADRIDVWQAPNDGAQFERLSNPFPGLAMYSHPRLRVHEASGDLYVAAQASDWTVFMAKWNGSSWTQPLRVSNPAQLYPTIQFASGRKVRAGPQFAFDIGAASEGGNDAVRLLYTQKEEKTGRLYVTGSYARLDLTGAWAAPEWGTTPGNLNTPGDQFNPNVRAWDGFIGMPPVWKAAYVDRHPAKGDTLRLKQGNLTYFPDGTRIYLPFNAMDYDIPICPDTRGYWGDYDDLEISEFSGDPPTPTFIRTVSDSGAGCEYEWKYTSHHVHIRAATFK